MIRRYGMALLAFVCFGFAESAQADVVADWHQIAISATAGPPPVEARALAIVHAAIFDAVNSIEHRYKPYAVDMRAPSGASGEAAAAAAAHGILVRLNPAQQPAIDAALASSLAKLPDGPGKSEGVALGREVAEKLFALRAGDGANAKRDYAFAAAGPGIYQPTLPMNAPPVLPQWRYVKPFLIMSATQFEMAGPPAPDSAHFARDLAEVKRLGGKASGERSNEETAIAIHWAGSEVPPFNAVARAAAAAHRLTRVESARLFALLNMSMADSLIVGFEAKYRFNSWRPITAIRNAPAGNEMPVTDSQWEPLLVTPPHQEYPCAHCLTAGAAIAVLEHVVGSDAIDASYVYPPLGVMRHWISLAALQKEVGDARVWGGIHFRTAVEHGTATGRMIAEYGLKNHIQSISSN
jgi:hypothetical protein